MRMCNHPSFRTGSIEFILSLARLKGAFLRTRMSLSGSLASDIAQQSGCALPKCSKTGPQRRIRTQPFAISAVAVSSPVGAPAPTITSPQLNRDDALRTLALVRDDQDPIG